ncbi:MAG: pyridoxamine 5'-phosphate oxidase family protein [Deltaproteobacteria bacterium]|jgi:nitroimidazol reductase NimA-like FMN-containing flavoprotein (pyridoxamine 5'-phosphate oxidase superfamily)|nr:pyridoxamine 5'-phosphate oxidase family protein [Deltaproteobacteria bacterium]MBW2512659.1 pyridoxamine 5'-phosphate oxidase family protein [Deltaproteobacteria bacterium]MDH4008438.1 pyridoxamine 5'-phosphate oxidase family protein [Desulfuromonadales bacterium]
MRRKDKAMQDGAIIGLLQNGEYGVLSTVDGNEQPYGVPLNYVLMNNCIYFHCALEGHKLDNLAANRKVSFCVVGRTKVLPAEFSTEFESVIVFGRASLIEGEERYQALNALIEKYSPEFVSEGSAYIEKFDSQTNLVRLEIQHMTGKAKMSS